MKLLTTVSHRKLLTSSLIVLCLQVMAQMPDRRQYRQLPEYPFVLVSDGFVTTPPEISDSLFDAASRGIRFKVNRTELQDNDPFIPLYKKELVPWLKSQDLQLRHLYVRGAASPEGPYNNNVRLSKERTKRLIDFLMTELGQADSLNQMIDAKNITEDYGLLVKLMRQANDADYERVNKIWQSCSGDEVYCKKRLMALDNGAVWKRLLQQYFPSLRQARVILLFARKQAPLEMVSQEVSIDTVPVVLQEIPVDTLSVVLPEEPVEYVRRHLIAIRTNLVHDLLYVPQFGWAYGANVQLEYYPLRGHYTLNAGFTFTNHRHWSDYKFFQVRDAQLELRRYFKGNGAFIGPYLGLYGEGTAFGIGFNKNKGWEGEGGGGGLSLGYTCPLNRKGSLRLEFSASVGVFITRYDPYVYGDPISREETGLYYYDFIGNSSDFKKRNHQFTWFGPTNFGIHLTYDIIYRKKKPLISSQQKGGRR